MPGPETREPAGHDATRAADPVPWPQGYSAAAVLSFDMDAESVALAISPTNRARLSVMSHQAYGPVTGVPRILRMLARRGLRATFFCPGFTAERYPDLLRRILDAGHEIGHHGYLHEDMKGKTRQQEADIIDRGLDTLATVAGVQPAGYRAPMWESTYHTTSLLLDRGFLYDSSLMDCDVPYELAENRGPDARSIVELPIAWSLDDWEQYSYVPDTFGSGLIEDPAKALSMWRREVTAMHEDGGCFTLTCHPFLSGRLGRLAALEELIDAMQDLDGLWITTAWDIAQHTRGLTLQPRYFPQPQVRD